MWAAKIYKISDIGNIFSSACHCFRAGGYRGDVATAVSAVSSFMASDALSFMK